MQYLKLKNILSAAIIIAAGYGIYHYYPYLRAQLEPCTAPITYKTGSFDSRFNISQDQFKNAVADAAQIWDKAAGKQLFQFATDGIMPVNLVFDSRQQSADQLQKLGLSLDSTESSYDQLKKTYNSYQAQYQSLKQQFDALQQQFNAQKQQYQADVAAWNAHPGSRQQYEQLVAEGNQLNASAQTLNQDVQRINQLVDTINALASQLNRIGSELNQDVSTYNTTGKNLGEFQEGEYVSNGFSKEINIYEFDNYNMLVRVLAHELGHSLGMEHVDDPDAIMYKLNQSKNEKPTQADIAELRKVCNLPVSK